MARPVCYITANRKVILKWPAPLDHRPRLGAALPFSAASHTRSRARKRPRQNSLCVRSVSMLLQWRSSLGTSAFRRQPNRVNACHMHDLPNALVAHSLLFSKFPNPGVALHDLAPAKNSRVIRICRWRHALWASGLPSR